MYGVQVARELRLADVVPHTGQGESELILTREGHMLYDDAQGVEA